VLETVRLVISELVTNSIRHADLGPRDRIDLHVSLTANGVRVEVIDNGRGFRPSPEPTPRGTSGYGHFLVDQLADRWGVTRDGRTRVWAEVDLERARIAI
jgi:anti-sigma regulatory factor (Ser/Thr protein kinase)